MWKCLYTPCVLVIVAWTMASWIDTAVFQRVSRVPALDVCLLCACPNARSLCTSLAVTDTAQELYHSVWEQKTQYACFCKMTGKSLTVLACEELEPCHSGLLAVSVLNTWVFYTITHGVIFCAPYFSFTVDREMCFLGAQTLNLPALLDLVNARCGFCLWMEEFASAQRNTNAYV